MAKEDPVDQVIALHEGTCTSSTPTLDPWQMKQMLQEPLTAEDHFGNYDIAAYMAPPLDQAIPAPYIPPATDRVVLNYVPPTDLVASLLQDLLVRVQKLEQQLAEMTAKRPIKSKPHKSTVKKGK